MEFFSLKATCAICKKTCGLCRFQTKDKLWVCPRCFKMAGLNMSSPIGAMTIEDIKSMIPEENSDAKKLATFHTTKQVAGWLKVDENAREWFILDGFKGGIKNPRVHSYDDILDFELLEDNGSIIKGGLGRAVAGGFLFGSLGAIVGGVTGKRKGKSTCSFLKIKITLNDMKCPTEYINLITKETKKNSTHYKVCEKQAHEILFLFQVMCESNKEYPKSSATTMQGQSVADEIVKFKQLFDSGVITKEEFETKKKQLLDL